MRGTNKLKTSKGSKRPRRSSVKPSDTRPLNRMSMGRAQTRQSFEANEIERDAPSRDAQIAHNRENMAAYHKTLKPMRPQRK